MPARVCYSTLGICKERAFVSYKTSPLHWWSYATLQGETQLRLLQLSSSFLRALLLRCLMKMKPDDEFVLCLFFVVLRNTRNLPIHDVFCIWKVGLPFDEEESQPTKLPLPSLHMFTLRFYFSKIVFFKQWLSKQDHSESASSAAISTLPIDHNISMTVRCCSNSFTEEELHMCHFVSSYANGDRRWVYYLNW